MITWKEPASRESPRLMAVRAERTILNSGM
jgi:hypothetical protein